MTDITNIKQYMEWRAQREGQKVDVSPEAWAHHVASEDLARAAVYFISFENEHTTLSSQAWLDLRTQTMHYMKTEEALNAD